MKRRIPDQTSLLVTIFMALTAEIFGATSSVGQPQIGGVDLVSRAQEDCIRAAEAKGFIVDSVVSSQAEPLIGGEVPASTRITVVLALTKEGFVYTLTCPLTLAFEEEEILQEAAEATTQIPGELIAANRAADRPIRRGAHNSFSWLWLLLPLLAFLSLLWLLVRKRPDEEHRLVETIPPRAPTSPPSPIFLTPTTSATTETFAKPPTASADLEPAPPNSIAEDFSMADSTEDKDLKAQPIPIEEQVLQVIQEEMVVGTRELARSKVRVHKRVETHEKIVNVPVVHEQVVVEHISKNQVVEDNIPQDRDEAGMHIIPFFEEVAVIETRLLLREEVHISKRRVSETSHQSVTLRQEIANVERTLLDEGMAVEDSSTPDRLVNSSPSLNPEPISLEPVTDTVRADQLTPSAFRSEVDNLNYLSLPKPTATSATVPGGPEDFPAATTVEEMVIPVMAEEVTLATQTVPRSKVRVHKRVVSQEKILESPAVREELVIQHVPVNQYVEGIPPEERVVDGVHIIPILVEEVVTKTQLVLREEVRISKHRTTETVPQTVTLRYEVVDVEEIDLNRKPAE